MLQEKTFHFNQYFSENAFSREIEHMFLDPHLAKIASDKTILIVEDDITQQFILKTIFRKMHFQVIIAENGLEAIRKFGNLETKRSCFIVMDIQMPEMNGLQASQVIRKDYGHSFPIYAYSANDPDPQNLGDASKSGMNGWIEKSEVKSLARVVYSWAIANNNLSYGN
jgi:CheY-like chemotaxis protein